jgi:hypothetical protein
MTKAARRAKRGNRRCLFDEVMAGVEAMREHREGRLTLRTHRVERGGTLEQVEASLTRRRRALSARARNPVEVR